MAQPQLVTRGRGYALPSEETNPCTCCVTRVETAAASRGLRGMKINDRGSMPAALRAGQSPLGGLPWSSGPAPAGVSVWAANRRRSRSPRRASASSPRGCRCTFRGASAPVLCCLRSKDPDAAADFLTAVLAAFLEVSGRPEAGL